MKTYPAVSLRGGHPDLLYPILDDFTATAIEERPDEWRAFFASADARDAALIALSGVCDASPIEVCDDDWARRSQQNLEPVTVGRITIVAEADPKSIHNPKSPIQNVEIVIPASMAFGTGHHATTRLCLAALQEIGVTGKSILDVGTGSGVLAIAAERLGAARAIGIDSDPDAVESARSNLACNPGIARVSFELADLASTSLAQADVVTANLTGALLARSAPLLLAATRPGGSLVLSGLMRHERDDVCAAFGAAAVVWERREEEWVGLVMKKP